MTDLENTALLPTGMRDILPPDADYSADVMEQLRAVFRSWGYQSVNPPVIEFESSLLDGAGAGMSAETFRLMDPVSQKMMGVRADMTLQVARIAATRLRNAPRPLRICYAGDVLRVRGSQLRPERQFAQVGAELIGAPDADADVEVVTLAIKALQKLGITDLTVDLSFPTLVPTLCSEMGLSVEEEQDLRSALDRKDAAAINQVIPGEKGVLFLSLLDAAGPMDGALAALQKISLPAAASDEADRLAEVAQRVQAILPNLGITIDPVEFRGFEYHTGLSFTLYRKGVRGEMGSGGRYVSGAGISDRQDEAATGFTLYLDTILRALPGPETPRTLYAPAGTDRKVLDQLRNEGWVVLSAIHGDASTDIEAEASRLECSHLLRNGTPTALSNDQTG